MSEEAEGGEEKAPRIKIDPQILIVALSSLSTIAALGVMAYTKLIYQKPLVTEEVALKHEVEEIKKPVVPEERPLVSFDQVTINIAMTSGKAHYATVAYAVECRDSEGAAQVRGHQAQFMDKLIAALGHRQLTELNTIQGKLLLKTELMREFNKLVPEGSVTDLFFANFILQ